MAARRPPEKPPSKTLSVDDMRIAIKKIHRRLGDLGKLDTNDVDQWDAQSDAILAKIDDTMSEIFGNGTVEYFRWNVSSLDTQPLVMGGFGDYDRPDPRRYWAEGVAQAKIKLQNCIDTLQEKIDDAEPQQGPLVPAADRVVSLNHNSGELANIKTNLAQLRFALHEERSNTPDHNRREAELMAAIGILNAPEVRPGVIEELLIKLLRDLIEAAYNQAITAAATALLAALALYFGIQLVN